MYFWCAVKLCDVCPSWMPEGGGVSKLPQGTDLSWKLGSGSRFPRCQGFCWERLASLGEASGPAVVSS